MPARSPTAEPASLLVLGNDQAKPTLRPATVAFADAMGTSARSRHLDGADHFLRVLSEALVIGQRVAVADRYAHDVQASWFSDNVCLSVANTSASGLSVIAQSCGAVVAAFATKGVFLRGALTLDLHYQAGATAFGPALTAAVEAEKQLAIYPRVILLEPALDVLLLADADEVFPLARDTEDGRVFVDFIQYMRDDLRGMARAILDSGDEAERLSQTTGSDRALMQLQWLETYFLDSTGRSIRRLGRRLRRLPGRFERLTSIP